MLRPLTLFIVTIALLAFGSMQGAVVGDSDISVEFPGDTVSVDFDLNLSLPLDNITIIDINGTINDGIQDINNSLPIHGIPDSHEVPENITFQKEHSGLKGIPHGASSGIRSSPGILTEAVGLGLTRTQDLVPRETKESGKASTTILYSLVGEGSSRLVSKLPAQQPATPTDVKVSSNQFIATTMVGVIIMAFASVFFF